MQAWGITGHLDYIWVDVGSNNGWLGGSGKDWERGPYYLDGLLPLAYILGDEGLMAKANRWVEAALTSQRPNGDFGPPGNSDWRPRFIMPKVLSSYHDATGGDRVLPFMIRYFGYMLDHLPQRPLEGWAQAWGMEATISLYWLYNRTGDAFLLELAELIRTQSFD